MPDAVVLELLGRRTLLMDIIALPRAKRCVHLGATAGIYHIDGREVEVHLVACKLEHGERLPAVIHQHLAAAKLVPLEVHIRLARG